MQPFVRKLLLIGILLLGFANIPAQGFLSSSDETLWPVMAEHFSLPNSSHSQVLRQIHWDLKNRAYIQTITENAKPYLYYIYTQTRKDNLPAELALLPMIESNYKPNGSSRVGAAGLWQLMPHTANSYGVKMNYWYDGRRSTMVSTKVALHFLSYLYESFDHNWLLAIAAYNAGPGAVTAAIRYNKAHGRPTDFWSLPLPAQTRAYVPKLLALATIVAHPNKYGFHLAKISNKSVTSTVTVKKQMPLTTIAHMAGTSLKTVKTLNPALRTWETPPNQSLKIVLPADKKSIFKKHLTSQKTPVSTIENTNQGHYLVKNGDTLNKIALAFKTDAKTLLTMNHLKTDRIHDDQLLLVPKHSQTYAVKSGDNLSLLANRYHVTPRYIMQINHLASTTLHIGQQLKMPV